MIARQDTYSDTTGVWAKLAAPVPTDVISWRQDGKVTERDGRFFARFVAYVEARHGSRQARHRRTRRVGSDPRANAGCAGRDGDPAQYAFKARLQVLGVIREDIGMGRDYKQASTDAFKRAAVRFGVAHELYAYEQTWVEMDGDGKYARRVEDPQTAYVRRHGRAPQSVTPLPSSILTNMEAVSCPKCGGRMWDNRLTKRNPKAPDYKCQNRSCDGVIWPAKAPVAALPGEGYTMAGGGSTVTVPAEEMPF